ncbi:hypothetical protein OE88DRAFT_1657239 [Heliocybe sulcata]|uniref:Association with the SNF1 complex (ASC) domain-containing protein n=1 Tax=Heliocybe sulcata TaxID=5364 RepID=A0A5C3N552_9AGAM|nr:hypothetical protein OE88DRAFT_1657239 [Heliocybe sulcata]
MGNTSSQPSAARPQSRRLDSPARNDLPHRSLRTKKKSLELPDLASLSLTPANTSPGRRAHPHAAPIPIPATPNPNQGAGFHDPAQPYISPQRHQNNTSDDLAAANNANMPDVLVQHASNHIPIYPPNQRPKGGNPYYRSAPYPSSRSIASRSGRTPSYQALPSHHEFVQETVYSTIPIALGKADEERTHVLFEDDEDPARRKKSVEAGEPVPFRITWRGGGNEVVLIRAGDDSWQGQQPMEKDSDGIFSVTVPLPRGTHHIRFVVDHIQRVADDLPSAVADDGTLANYVAVPISGLTPPSSSPAQPSSPLDSFWSEDSASTSTANPRKERSRERAGAKEEEVWTQEFPEALIAAAREEESYLAIQSDPAFHQGHAHAPAPNIPPAPVLPRFLDKLILNSRPGMGVGPPRDAKEARREERRSRSKLAVLASSGSQRAASTDHPIPVTTASGTDVSKGAGDQNRELTLDGAGMADDASVLPVPSHVVLQHLSTSAIKNGVLAVGTTIRYKKKVPHYDILQADLVGVRRPCYLTNHRGLDT